MSLKSRLSRLERVLAPEAPTLMGLKMVILPPDWGAVDDKGNVNAGICGPHVEFTEIPWRRGDKDVHLSIPESCFAPPGATCEHSEEEDDGD